MPYTPPSGNAAHLSFAGSYTPPAANAVELNFDPLSILIDWSGTLDDLAGSFALGFTPTNPTLAMAGFLDDGQGEWILQDVALLDLSGTLDDLSGSGEMIWFAGVWRGIESQRTTAANTLQSRKHRQTQAAHQQAGRQNPINAIAWQPPQPLPATRTTQWGDVPRKHIKPQSGWGFIPAKPASKTSGYAMPPAKPLPRQGAWGLANPLHRERQDGYTSPPRHDLQPTIEYQLAQTAFKAYGSGYGIASAVFKQRFIAPWEQGNPHSWIWGGWHYPPPEPGVPYLPSPHLVFYQPMENFTGGAILEFNRPCYAWPLYIKSTKHYEGTTIVLHTVKVTRLPDLTNVPALSASLQFDSDSWCWSVSLNLQTSAAMALLEPVSGEPRQVRIELDGVYVSAIIESWGERRQFGETVYSAQGRSTLALMAAPYAPIKSLASSSQQTAAQLIDAELLNTGWSAAYHADVLQLFTSDWLVPTGAWSYQNLSPIDAIVKVAKAVGARAFADKTAGLVHIAPRYPVSPWNWSTATPDKTIPVSLARSINTQLNPRPDYNQIYVSGQNQGVIVSASRQGSAGDKPAPMITDSLITYVNAGRERARNELSNTGRQARVTLDLPLNATTGLLEPGQLVEVSDTTAWRGLITATSINAQHGAIGQQVEIERHY